MKRILQLIVVINSLLSTASAQQTIIKYLSGTDKDHAVQWDFMVTKGQNSNEWSKIGVPSNWELQGFGKIPALQVIFNNIPSQFITFQKIELIPIFEIISGSSICKSLLKIMKSSFIVLKPLPPTCIFIFHLL